MDTGQTSLPLALKTAIGTSNLIKEQKSSRLIASNWIWPNWLGAGGWVAKKRFWSLPGRAFVAGRTRTREKYRTVYTEQQKLELEKEYEKGTFINAQRKTDVAKEVGLSERQVKIWFQNRRAKDRRIRRKAAEGEGGEGEEDDDEDCVSTSHGFPAHSSIALHQDVHSTVDSDAMLINSSASYDQPMYEYLRTDRRH